MTSSQKHSLDDLKIDRSASGRKSPWPLIVIVVLAVSIAAVFVAWKLKRPAAAEVRTITVTETSGASGGGTVLNASGYVTARRQATVSSKVTGKVIEVLIEEGMTVKEGQVLARIDDSNVQTNLRLAAAQLESAKATLSETRVRLDQAGRELKRIAGLAAEKVASPAELDRAESEFKSLKARLELQASEVTVAERQVALWQQQLEDTVIRAPFGGVVVTKNAQPGEMISPISAGGGFTRTGIGTVVDMTSLEIEVDVNESFINRVEPGGAVVATLDSYADWKIPAKVIAIVPTADRQKATVKVRIGFDQLDPRILPDMGVKVAFRGGEGLPATKTAITMPKGAVRRLDSRDVVMIVRNGRAERRAVSLGATRSDEVTIVAGLSAGDRVVVDGPAGLSEGDRVTEKSAK